MKNVLAICSVILMGLNANSQDNLEVQERPPIIDMHMHTGLPHHVPAGTPAICRPEPCTGEGQATVNPSELMEKTLEAMDQYHIIKGFLSGVDFSAVQEWSKTAPGCFITSPFTLKAGPSELEQLRTAYASGRFNGMGEIGTQLNGVPPNDPSLEPYFALAEELDLPVLIHTLGIGPYMPHFNSAAGNPLLLEDVLVSFLRLSQEQVKEHHEK